MEPIHVYTLLHTRIDPEIRWTEIEQRFAVRADVRRRRLERVRRIRRLFVAPAAVRTPQPAV